VERKKLGYTDLELTRIGLGTWAIGGPWQYGWGPQNDADSIATILRAIDAGINWIDTAPIYGCGHAEKVIGQALAQLSEKPIIATKCGLRWDEQHQRVACLDAESIRREIDESLERLGVETIDLYQIHWPEPEEKIEEAWEEIAKAVEAGKIRYAGLSNCNVEQISRLQPIQPVASLQPLYNMLIRFVEVEMLEFCARNNIGVICYSPMQKGLLTGKFTPEKVQALAEDDHRRRDPTFKPPIFDICYKLIEDLRPIAEKSGRTMAQMAISWVLRRDEVTAAIVGARRPGQIEETVQAADRPLSEQELQQIEPLLKDSNEAIMEFWKRRKKKKGKK
jgi:aryl-alcohol dehydrogenase-like predicted oxidoreductase